MVRLALVGLAAVVAFSVVLTARVIGDSLAPEQAVWKDFGQEYLLARAVADGIDPYLAIRAVAERYLTPTGYLDKPFPTPHPPSVGLLFLPFVLVDYVTAVRVWLLVQVVGLVSGLYLSGRVAGVPRPRLAAVVGSLVLIAWPPVQLDLILGQVTTVLLALLAGSALAGVQGRTTLAGVLLGVSLLVKPLAWPWLLVLAARRRWSAVAAAVGLGVVGTLVPAVRVGWAPIAKYCTDVLPAISALYATEITNLSWWTLGPRLFAGTTGLPLPVEPVVFSPPTARMVGAAVPLLVLGTACAWLVRSWPGLETALGVMTLVALTVNPIAWPYYLVLAVLPGVLVIGALRERRFAWRPTAVAVLLAVGLQPLGSELREVGLRLTSGTGQTTGQMTPLTALITLEPSLAVLGLAVLLAALDQRRPNANREVRDGA